MTYCAVLLCVLVLILIFFWYNAERNRKQMAEEQERVKGQLICALRAKALSAQTLYDLYDVHSQMAQHNLCAASGPCIYGIVRVKDIRDLTPDNIYLGNIYGIWTKTLPAWSVCNDQEAKDIVFGQYQRLLLSDL